MYHMSTIFLGLVVLIWSWTPITSSSLPSPASYFSSNYTEARSRFLSLAQKCSAELKEYEVLPGYTTNVAIIRSTNPNAGTLLHISGTHGAEGYAGSAVQLAVLDELCASPLDKESLPNLIFVHALNPYGFANNRRVNEENIDLNRNFLTDEEFDFVKKRDPNFANYVTLYDILNPQGQPYSLQILNDISQLFRILQAVLIHGVNSIKRALVSGNYHYPKGLGFGGFTRSTSVRNLQQLVEENKNSLFNVDQFVMIDVHTGLGPAGVDTIASFHSDKVSDQFETLFPTDVIDGKTVGGLKSSSAQGKSVVSGYEETVGTSDLFCEKHLLTHLSTPNKWCITQEFGTVPSILVGKALSEENYYHHFGNDEQRKTFSEALKGVFYLDSVEWKTAIVRRGLKVLYQGVEFLKQSCKAK